jgi:hypothetical protein
MSQLAKALFSVAEHSNDLNAPFVAHAIEDFTNSQTLAGIMLVPR